MPISSNILATSEITAISAAMQGPVQADEYRLPAAGDFSGIPDLFAYPVKNFGRFPDSAKAACAACALVFKAAGLTYAKGGRTPIALLCAGYQPTADMNEAFFRDYIDGGRTMGRGNLFIYTLPTSPAAEVSIHFGLAGPTLFLQNDEDPEGDLVTAAGQMLAGSQAEKAVCIWQDRDRTRCNLIGGRRARP